MLKKFTALIITITIILVNTNNVNAGLLDIGTVITGLNGAFNLSDSNEKKRSDLSNWVNQNSTWAGFIFDAALTSNYLTPSLVYSVLPQSVKDTISDSSDESEILNKTIDMILEGQSVSGNDITNNTNVNTFIKNISNQYVNDSTGKYYYACDLSKSTNDFGSNILQISNLLNTNPDCMFTVAGDENTSTVRILGFKLTSNCYAVQRTKFDNYWSLCDFYYADVQDGIISTHYAGEIQSDNIVTYVASSTSTIEPYEATYPMINPYQHPIVRGYINALPDQSVGGSSWRQYPKCITNSRQGIMMFSSLNDLNSYLIDYGVGKQAYYYNNSVWQDFSSSTGDYTFSPSNINTVTYGDTVSYVNDYHGIHNEYPDNSTVNNWINTTNNNTTSGGESGDDSGGSGSDSPSDIFGWLKLLGAVLGSLIKGVGEFLTEIVTGLVSAINNLLSGISDLIKNITESLPTVFMDFLGTLFSWLPDEWLALFSASIIFMLLWGIIKTIRGS